MADDWVERVIREEKIKKIIQSKSKADFNCVKSRQSLLQKAIEVRAKECFDLLIEIPNLEIIRIKKNFQIVFFKKKQGHPFSVHLH